MFQHSYNPYHKSNQFYKAITSKTTNIILYMYMHTHMISHAIVTLIPLNYKVIKCTVALGISL